GGGDGGDAARRVRAGPGERGRVRRAVRGVRDPARLLRPGRQRGAAPAACPARPGAGRAGRRGREHAVSNVPESMREAVERARVEVCRLHAALVSNGLVAWTSGNVSARVPMKGEGEAGGGRPDLMVIKPSGIEYPNLTPGSMVVCDLDGTRGDGADQPSRDTPSHAYPYPHLPPLRGGLHTPFP